MFAEELEMLMDSQDEKAQLNAWLKGQLSISFFKFVVVGDHRDVPTRIDAFACLYPMEPRFRILRGAAEVPERELRAAVRACELPADAEEIYWRHARENTRGMGTDDRAWRAGEGYAIKLGLPLGLYAMGRTREDQPRAAVWMNALLSPTRFLRELKKEARG